jgi:hypothetical protein
LYYAQVLSGGSCKLFEQKTNNKQQTTMADNNTPTDNNPPTRTFEEAFGDVPVDPNVPTAGSRFARHPENLEEEARRLRLNQDDINKDFNEG